MTTICLILRRTGISYSLALPGFTINKRTTIHMGDISASRQFQETVRNFPVLLLLYIYKIVIITSSIYTYYSI